VVELADRRNHRGRPRAERLEEIAARVAFDHLIDREITLDDVATLASEELDDRIAGSAGQNTPVQSRSDYLVLEDEKNVHRPDFLDSLLVNIEPEHLGVAPLFGA